MPPARPPTIAPSVDTIPVELRERPQWVIGRWTYQRQGAGSWSWTKPPYQTDGRLARANDATTWTSFEKVWAAYQRGGWDFVGFVFSPDDPYTVFDIDNCVHGTDVEEWAREIVDDIASYTEVSPSGTGLRIILKARVPTLGRKKKGTGIQVQDRGLWTTLTGQHLLGTPLTIEERQEALDHVRAKLFPPDRPLAPPAPRGPPTSDDGTLLSRARAARNGEAFARLFDRGDWQEAGFPSQSEADMALCSHLAFWWGGDPAAIDRMFRQSALMREKWQRPTYREQTIQQALEGTGKFYAPHDGAAAEPDTSNLYEEDPAVRRQRLRETVCWSCSRVIDNRADVVCTACGWIRCPACGACEPACQSTLLQVRRVQISEQATMQAKAVFVAEERYVCGRAIVCTMADTDETVHEVIWRPVWRPNGWGEGAPATRQGYYALALAILQFEGEDASFYGVRVALDPHKPAVRTMRSIQGRVKRAGGRWGVWKTPGTGEARVLMTVPLDGAELVPDPEAWLREAVGGMDSLAAHGVQGRESYSSCRAWAMASARAKRRGDDAAAEAPTVQVDTTEKATRSRGSKSNIDGMRDNMSWDELEVLLRAAEEYGYAVEVVERPPTGQVWTASRSGGLEGAVWRWRLTDTQAHGPPANDRWHYFTGHHGVFLRGSFGNGHAERASQWR